MWRRTWLVGAAALVGIAAARVHAQEADPTLQPVKLSLQPAPPADERVYALPVPATEDQGTNQGPHGRDGGPRRAKLGPWTPPRVPPRPG